LNSKVGIVVPTLGTRPDYLRQCLQSIMAAGDAYILLVAPGGFDSHSLIAEGLIDSTVEDPRAGLSEAINIGVRALPAEVEFVNWLGDDDLLAKDSIEVTQAALSRDNQTVMVFGSCNYIDSNGEIIWTNHSGQWAVPLLRFGPDLIPQPGALFRRSAFENTGGLSADFNWAFDFDLFIRFSKIGKVKYLDRTLASFRWHPESLSVEYRRKSVAEASAVRVRHLPGYLKLISGLWEFPVKQATLWAGKRVTSRARSKVLAK
jgi:GT2 family glycosyltransferase